MHQAAINPFPPRRRGLWHVRAVPYLTKEADFRPRWQAAKAMLRDQPAGVSIGSVGHD